MVNGPRTSAVNISLLLPTRGRVALVHRLFDSLVGTTNNLRGLEVVLYVDEDDLASREISHAAFSLIKVVGPPGTSMGKMNRACYAASHGRYVMLINDDLVFQTANWDIRVLDAARHFPDEIALVYGNDLDQEDAVPTFPILSRTACHVLGEICPRAYLDLYIDVHLLDIFKQLRRLGHDRILYLKDVVFEHMHHVVGKASPEMYYKKNQRADEILFIALNEERMFKAKLLSEYIETSRKTQSGFRQRSF
jgi:hypothetical protein